MEWLDLAMWILAALLALALGRGALDQPAFGMTVMSTLAGLALCIVFLATGGAVGWAWGTLAAAVVAVLALSSAVVWLERSDERRPSRIGADDESVLALLSGFELPLLGLAATFALLMALDVATTM